MTADEQKQRAREVKRATDKLWSHAKKSFAAVADDPVCLVLFSAMVLHLARHLYLDGGVDVDDDTLYQLHRNFLEQVDRMQDPAMALVNAAGVGSA